MLFVNCEWKTIGQGSSTCISHTRLLSSPLPISMFWIADFQTTWSWWTWCSGYPKRKIVFCVDKPHCQCSQMSLVEFGMLLILWFDESLINVDQYGMYVLELAKPEGIKPTCTCKGGKGNNHILLCKWCIAMHINFKIHLHNSLTTLNTKPELHKEMVQCVWDLHESSTPTMNSGRAQ